jgi:tRNA A37 methylthiotransferase MiaB
MREFHDLADELMAQRAEDRIGETVEVLIETATDGEYEGRAAHQGPDDGSTTVLADRPLAPGDLVTARVVESLGADLVARA